MVLDADAAEIDVLAVSAHKWLLGPSGIGFVALSERAMQRLHPSENAAGIAGLAATIATVLEIGREAVETTVLDRAAELADLLEAAGLRISRPADRSRCSGILIATTGHDDAMLYRRLLEARVLCPLRGAGIRFSPHYYTTTSNLEHLARQLKTPSP